MKGKSVKGQVISPKYVNEARLILQKAESALSRAGKIQLKHYNRNRSLELAAKTALKAVKRALSGFMKRRIHSRDKLYFTHLFYYKALFKKYIINSDKFIQMLDLIDADLSESIGFNQYVHAATIHDGFKMAHKVIEIIEHSAIFGRPLRMKKVRETETMNIQIKIEKESFLLIVKKGLDEGKNAKQYITDKVMETIFSELRIAKPKKILLGKFNE